MLLTKRQLSVAAFVSKNDKNPPALASVLIAPTYAVATNSYSLAFARYLNKRTEEDAPIKEPVLVPGEACDRARKAIGKAFNFCDFTADAGGAKFRTDTGTVEALTSEEKFPDVVGLIEEKEKLPVLARVRLDAAKLIQAAKFIEAANVDGNVDLELRGENEPVFFLTPGFRENDGTTKYSEGALALVMPILNK